MRTRKAPAFFGILLIVLIAIILLWDWNWFKPLVETQASAALGRKVTIGHFDLRIFHNPAVIIDDIVVENPKGFSSERQMASAKKLVVRVAIRPLLGGKIVLPEIMLDQPHGDFRRLTSGDANWVISSTDRLSSSKLTKTNPPDIGNLVIKEGLIHYQDAKLKADFLTHVHTETGTSNRDGRIVVDAKGTYAAKPITAHFEGGSVLNLREPSRPYPINLTAANGASEFSLKGTVENPIAFAGANVVLTLKGNDLADLFPLTGIPFPATPGYHLSGNLDYADNKVRFRNIVGVVGSSDLEGEIDEDPGTDRPLITANLTSRLVSLADLGGFIGSTPGTPGTANYTSKQAEQHAKAEASPKLLPNTPINLPKLRSADLDVTYKGQRIQGKSVPLDNLDAHLIVKDGTLALKPLNFGVGQGQIASNISLDGRQNLVHAVADIDFRKIDVSRIMQSTGVFKGVGTIGGRANIDATGNSLAQLLGSGNGELILLMKGGDISAILVDLAGLDFGNTLLSALGLPNRAAVRCMVSSFGLQQGLLQTRLLVVDTEEANIIGKGIVDLRGNERIDYQLTTEPKHFSIGSLGTPIDVRGPLKSPSILPDPVSLAERGGAAAVLGVLLTPLGALIPTIQLGLGEDNDCHTLVQQATAETQRLQSSPTAAKAAGKRPKPLGNHHKTP